MLIKKTESCMIKRVQNIISIGENIKPAINPVIKPKKYSGFFQYYFSDRFSTLPIRDVNNTCGQGFKTEPHLEIGAENYIKKCTQSKITSAIKNHLLSMFLVTKCRNKELKEFFDKQFIVGFIRIQDIIQRTNKKGENFFAVMGKPKIVSYKDAICVPDLYGKNLDRGDLNKKLTDEEVMSFLNHLDKKEDITPQWIEEIDRIDQQQSSCLGASECKFLNLCKRFKS